MRKLVLGAALAVAMLLPRGAAAQQSVDTFLQPAPAGPPESGLSVAVSAGYALPMGTVGGTTALSDFFSGGVPLQADIGWRFNPYIYLGAFFQYSFAFPGAEMKDVCNTSGVSCSGGSMQFGADLIWTILPYAGFIPYVGLGAGYEISTLTISGGGQSVDFSFYGWQFARIIAGADVRIGSTFRIGPFANFSFGQYGSAKIPTYDPATGNLGPAQTADITDKKLHEWLQFGLKVTADL